MCADMVSQSILIVYIISIKHSVCVENPVRHFEMFNSNEKCNKTKNYIYTVRISQILYGANQSFTSIGQLIKTVTKIGLS